MLKIAVLVSGGGTNLQALLDAQARGEIQHGQIACVISSNPDAYALTRAKNAGIPGETLSRKDFPSAEAYDHALLDLLDRYQTDLIVLAGFMTIIREPIVNRYSGRIINIHPALIPAFCGKGYYGLHVHEKVLEYGAKVTGATVHFVDEGTDTGPIILQKAVSVLDDDTPEILQQRVLRVEHELLPLAVAHLVEGRIRVEGRKVTMERMTD